MRGCFSSCLLQLNIWPLLPIAANIMIIPLIVCHLSSSISCVKWFHNSNISQKCGTCFSSCLNCKALLRSSSWLHQKIGFHLQRHNNCPLLWDLQFYGTNKKLCLKYSLWAASIPWAASILVQNMYLREKEESYHYPLLSLWLKTSIQPFTAPAMS